MNDMMINDILFQHCLNLKPIYVINVFTFLLPQVDTQNLWTQKAACWGPRSLLFMFLIQGSCIVN